MEKKKVIFFMVVFAIVLIGSITLTYSKLFILGMKEVDFSVKVGDNVGLNVDTDQLYFGIVPKVGGVSSRSIFIQNEAHSIAKVHIKSYGEKKEWLYASKNNFFLKKEEGENIEFRMKVPKDAEPGTYEGRILIIFTRF